MPHAKFKLPHSKLVKAENHPTAQTRIRELGNTHPSSLQEPMNHHSGCKSTKYKQTTHLLHIDENKNESFCTDVKCNMRHSDFPTASLQTSLNYPALFGSDPSCTNHGKRNLAHTSLFLVLTHQNLNHHPLHSSELEANFKTKIASFSKT